MIPLLRAAHLQPTVAVTAIATALAISAGRGRGAVAVGAAVLAGQLSVGWSNDYLDRARDREAGRLDKPIVAGTITARSVGIAAGIALLTVLPLSLLSGWRAAAVHVAAVGAAWLYNLRLKATAASFVPYVAAFAVLPAFVTLGLPTHPLPRWWAVTSGALLGAGAHFVNAVPDFEADARLGVRGLPHHLGARGSVLTGSVLIALAVLLLYLAPAGHPGVAATSIAVVTVATAAGVGALALTGRLRLAWSMVLLTAGLAVVMLLVQGGRLT